MSYKKFLFTVVFVLFLSAGMVFGSSHTWDDKKTSENFNELENPTNEDFNKLDDPSAENLAKLENPGVSEFQKLDSSSKANYIKSHADFSSGEGQSIGDDYFRGSSSNINNNLDSYEDYVSGKTGLSDEDFEISSDASIKSSEGDVITTSGEESTSFNVNHLETLKQRGNSNFEIKDDGSLSYTSEYSDSVSVNGGSISEDDNGGLVVNEGNIDISRGSGNSKVDLSNGEAVIEEDGSMFLKEGSTINTGGRGKDLTVQKGSVEVREDTFTTSSNSIVNYDGVRFGATKSYNIYERNQKVESSDNPWVSFSDDIIRVQSVKSDFTPVLDVTDGEDSSGDEKYNTIATYPSSSDSLINEYNVFSTESSSIRIKDGEDLMTVKDQQVIANSGLLDDTAIITGAGHAYYPSEHDENSEGIGRQVTCRDECKNTIANLRSNEGILDDEGISIGDSKSILRSDNPVSTYNAMQSKYQRDFLKILSDNIDESSNERESDFGFFEDEEEGFSDEEREAADSLIVDIFNEDASVKGLNAGRILGRSNPSKAAEIAMTEVEDGDKFVNLVKGIKASGNEEILRGYATEAGIKGKRSTLANKLVDSDSVANQEDWKRSGFNARGPEASEIESWGEWVDTQIDKFTDLDRGDCDVRAGECVFGFNNK